MSNLEIVELNQVNQLKTKMFKAKLYNSLQDLTDGDLLDICESMVKTKSGLILK